MYQKFFNFLNYSFYYYFQRLEIMIFFLGEEIIKIKEIIRKSYKNKIINNYKIIVFLNFLLLKVLKRKRKNEEW